MLCAEGSGASRVRLRPSSSEATGSPRTTQKARRLEGGTVSARLSALPDAAAPEIEAAEVAEAQEPAAGK